MQNMSHVLREDYKMKMILNCRTSLPESVEVIIRYFIEQVGFSQKFVAHLFNVSESTIMRRMQGVTSAENHGRRRLTAHQRKQRATKYKIIKDLNNIRNQRGRRVNASVRMLSSASAKKELGSGFSKSQIHRDLQAAGCTFTNFYRAPTLTPKHVQDRLAFCERYVDDTRPKVFIDEAWVDVNYHGGNKCGFYQWPGEKVDPLDQIAWKDQYPAKLMIFGAIGSNFKKIVVLPIMKETPNQAGWTLNAQRYQQMCLKPLLAHLKKTNSILVQDGASVHTAKATQEYLQQHGIKSFQLKWPARSPDLNPIENLWQIIKTRVTRHGARTVDQLREAVMQEWDDMDDSMLENLLQSFGPRCEAVMGAGGQFTSGHRRKS